MTSTDDELAAISEIREVLDDLIRYGFDPGSITGASDAEIDEMAASQKVPVVPAAVREILRLIGLRQGLFHKVGSFNIGYLDADWKSDVVEFLEEYPPGRNPIADTEHMLVFLFNQSESAAVVDGTRIHEPDPPMWGVFEGGRVVGVESVTAFFRSCAESVKGMIDL